MVRTRVVLSAVLILLAGLLMAGPAQAAGPTLTVSPTVVAPGGAITAAGNGFPASSLVDLYVDYDQVGFTATNSTGAYSTVLTVPASTAPGAHTVTAVAHNGSAAVQANLTVRTNWPQWRGNALGQGMNRFENVLNSSTVSDLDVEWSPDAVSVTSSAVTSGAYVYTVASNGHLRSHLRTTGALKFDVDVAATQLIPPIVAGAVVVTAGSGQIQARHLPTGALVWQASLPTGVGAPVYSKGVVYVVAEGSTTLTNGIYAFSATCGTGGATCTPLWIGPGGLGGGGYYFPEMSLAVGAGRVYARLGNDLVSFAVGCGTGGATCSPLSSAPGVASGTSPAFANNYVYSTEASSLVVRRPGCLSCSPVWTGNLPSPSGRTPTVAGSRVYVVQGSSLFVFSSSCGSTTCAPIWSTNTGGGIAYPPTVANGVVYVPTNNDLLAYPVSCWNGCSPLWNAGSGGTFSNAPYATVAVSDGKVYSPSSDGLQVYSTAPTPMSSKVDAGKLRPSPSFAAAEARAERRLAARR